HTALSACEGGAGEDGIKRLFQEQTSPPGSLSGHCFFSLASWVLTDSTALPPPRCLLSPPPWPGELERGYV
ncbi:unnamed protein product, partial [Gulo gulo]